MNQDLPKEHPVGGPDSHPMRSLLALLIVALGVALLAPLGASAAKPKKFYWSEERAESAVLSKVRLPYCVLEEDHPRCAEGIYRPNGRPRVGFFAMGDAECRGSGEHPSGFTYSRFMCEFLTLYGYAQGSILLTPTGAVKLKWKLVSLYDNRPCPCPLNL